MSSEVSSTVESCIPEGEDYLPNAEELEKYYIIMESGNLPELQWQCPGRRPPSPEGVTKTEHHTATECAETQEPVRNDFDFSDDVMQPQVRVRNQNSTPKSAKKKTADFAGVMEALKKKSAEGAT